MVTLIKPLSLFALTIGLLTGGCMSGRMTTDLIPQSNPNMKSPAGTFYVADFKLAKATRHGPQGAAYTARGARTFLPLLRRECMACYPGLFAEKPANAVPLGVEVQWRTTHHNGKIMAWMYGTLLLAGTIFPCPFSTDEDIAVNVYVWNGQQRPPRAEFCKTFRRETYNWISLLTPMALIAIPGESDFPKTSGTVFANSEMEATYLQQMAQQMATAIAQLVVTKDAAYWRSQPLGHVMPGLATQEQTPTALPPPGSAETPF